MFLGPEGSAHNPPPTIPCQVCGKQFIPGGPDENYCSLRCYADDNEINYHDCRGVTDNPLLYDWFDCGYGFPKVQKNKTCPACGSKPQSVIVIALR